MRDEKQQGGDAKILVQLVHPVEATERGLHRTGARREQQAQHHADHRAGTDEIGKLRGKRHGRRDHIIPVQHRIGGKQRRDGPHTLLPAAPNQPYALHGFRMSRRNLLSSYQIAKPTASIRPEATMSTKRIGRKSSGVIVIHLSVPNGN